MTSSKLDNLQRLCLQMRSHAWVLGVRASTRGFRRCSLTPNTGPAQADGTGVKTENGGAQQPLRRACLTRHGKGGRTHYLPLRNESLPSQHLEATNTSDRTVSTGLASGPCSRGASSSGPPGGCCRVVGRAVASSEGSTGGEDSATSSLACTVVGRPWLFALWGPSRRRHDVAAGFP